jgi:hypothetical protein
MFSRAPHAKPVNSSQFQTKQKTNQHGSLSALPLEYMGNLSRLFRVQREDQARQRLDARLSSSGFCKINNGWPCSSFTEITICGSFYQPHPRAGAFVVGLPCSINAY